MVRESRPLTQRWLRPDVVRVVRHDVRTQLGAVAGFSDLLLHGFGGSLSDEQRASVGNIAEAGRQLGALMTGYFDLVAIEAGTFEPCVAPVDVARVLEACRASVEPRLVAKGVEFTVQAPQPLPEFMSDAARLTHVLFLLLDFAERYTVEGTVALEVSAVGESVVFSITDSGRGVADDFLRRALDPPASRTSELDDSPPLEGTGLSLVMAGGLAQGLEGCLSIESRPGEGSRSTLSVPCTPASTAGTLGA